MKNIYRLIWSEEALNNLKEIINYLEDRWTGREIKNFVQLLDKQIKLIEDNPYLIAESIQSKGLRKSVLSRQTTIYYQIIDSEIRIITLFDNRQNPNRLIYK
jgi:plasmid stabilization system protein ParE